MYLIISNYLSALQIITKPLHHRTICPTVRTIRNHLQYLRYFHHIPTSFLWVSGHQGILETNMLSWSISQKSFELVKPLPISTSNLKRSDIVFICRLRSGHNRLPANLSRFNPDITTFSPFHPEDQLIADIAVLSNNNIYRPFSAITCLTSYNIKIFQQLIHISHTLPPEIIIWIGATIMYCYSQALCFKLSSYFFIFIILFFCIFRIITCWTQ